MKLFAAGIAHANKAGTCRPALNPNLAFIMRTGFIYIIVLFLAAQLLPAKAAGQDIDETYITLELKNESLVNAFKKIENQTGFLFAYQPRQVNAYSSLNLSKATRTVSQTISLILKGTSLTYRQAGNSIIISQKEGAKQAAEINNTGHFGDTTIRGRITDTTGNPMVGATVMLDRTNHKTVTDANGNFLLQHIKPGMYELTVTYVGFKKVGVPVTVTGESGVTINLSLKSAEQDMEEVKVFSTGYEGVPKERATGSFVEIDNELLNRRVSTNILDRLEGITSGLIFNKRASSFRNESPIAIRGRSTIFANPDPLIILDNFPYDGDLSNINPNDIESITILKDAAAASIWGSYSGNGVIVITTKKGKYNQRPKVSFNSNITVGERPDLFYEPILSSTNYIDVERFLFERGFYNSNPTQLTRPYISPVVEILFKQRNGQISADEAEEQINAFRNKDVRNDIERHVYQNSFNQQNAVSISGGSSRNQYYFSAGFDRNAQSLSNNRFSRITLTAKNTYGFSDNKLQLTTSILFTNSKTNSTDPTLLTYGRVPYEQLADEQGNALAVGKDFRQLYIDTAGGGRLLDWNYRPLDELNLSDNTTTLTDYRVNTGLKYKFPAGFEANVVYQYSKGVTDLYNYYSPESYYTRNLINRYSQINFATGAVSRPIPLGGILDTRNTSFYTNNLRVQLNYNHSWKSVHSVNAIAGAETRSMKTRVNSRNRLYGYDDELGSGIQVDFLTRFPQYYNSATTLLIPNISNALNRSSSIDNNLSYFTNAAYSYDERYTVSVSARKDESNIFGVNTNQKGVPLWSAGLLWSIHKEKFYRADWLPYLRFRMTNGYNGNVDKSVSAFVTASADGSSFYNAPRQIIVNPPNPELRWEKINLFNVGLDFATKENAISGSIEYYLRNGKDIIGNSPMAPSTGITQFRGNTADIKGSGIDIELHTKNIAQRLQWNSTFLFSYTADKVTNYKVSPPYVSYYAGNTGLYPVEGRPVYSLYSYKWGGLDSAGNPRGIVDGKPSSSYNLITLSPDINSLVYHGRATPAVFGSIRNTFIIKNLQFSFNITYKLGYSFKQSIFSRFSGFTVYPDFDKRWRQPGDESITNTPSLIYPANSSRNSFYENTEIMVHKADHVRLQDIQLSYGFGKLTQKLRVQSVRVYFYSNNIGLLWKANRKGIDPDFISGFPDPTTYAGGLQVDFYYDEEWFLTPKYKNYEIYIFGTQNL